MAAIAFTDAQIEQISAMATQIPRRLRDAYLQRVVQAAERAGLRRRRRTSSGTGSGGRDTARAAPGARWPRRCGEQINLCRATNRAG